MSDVLGVLDDRHDADDEESPFVCEYGIVHEVNPETLAIKALIPSLHTSVVHDKWITQVTPWVGTPGYGPVYAPAVGSEVLITGRYGEPFNLFYVSRFNETHPVPSEFADGARGAKLETGYRILADLPIQLNSQESIRLEGANLAEVVGTVVKLICGAGAVLTGGPGKIAFLDAEPIGKKTLPGPANDLATCIALTNALRAHELERGLCQ